MVVFGAAPITAKAWFEISNAAKKKNADTKRWGRHIVEGKTGLIHGITHSSAY